MEILSIDNALIYWKVTITNEQLYDILCTYRTLNPKGPSNFAILLRQSLRGSPLTEWQNSNKYFVTDQVHLINFFMGVLPLQGDPSVQWPIQLLMCNLFQSKFWENISYQHEIWYPVDIETSNRMWSFQKRDRGEGPTLKRSLCRFHASPDPSALTKLSFSAQKR